MLRSRLGLSSPGGHAPSYVVRLDQSVGDGDMADVQLLNSPQSLHLPARYSAFSGLLTNLRMRRKQPALSGSVVRTSSVTASNS